MTENRKGKSRRPQGEGTIVQRADGLFMFSIRLGRDPAGKPKRKYLYARTKGELKRKIADEKARGGGTLRIRGNETAAQWMEYWLEQKKPDVAKSTFASWSVAWHKHAKPIIGGIRLDEFDPQNVAGLYKALREQKTGGRTIQIVAQVLRAAFEAAILQEAYHRANPWRKVPVPKHETKEARALDAAEARKFIDAARSDRYEALWLLCILAGLRLGEALGLEWNDVDLETGVVNIRQQLTDVDGKVEIAKLKTRSSRRQIAVGPSALAALERRWAAAKGERHGSKFVFTTISGAFPNRGNLRNRNFAAVCQQAGIGKLTIHQLRHSMTSIAFASGVSPVVVAARLGHGSTRMSLDRYGHVLPGQQLEAAQAIEGQLGLKLKISRTTSKKVVVGRKQPLKRRIRK